MKTYTILNSEGDILKLEIEKDYNGFTKLTFCANTNIGMGRIYFDVSATQLNEFFNSKLTLSQIVKKVQEDRFLLIRYNKGYIVNSTFVEHGLQCGDILFRDILDDMKIGNKEVANIISDIQFICR